MKSKKKNWTVAYAKERLSEVLREAQREPQPIFNRDRLVAIVLNPEEFAAFEAWRRRKQAGSLADAFRELRDLCREEGHELTSPERIDRRNPFAEALDEPAA
jgi:hypothetical protein